jgi:predicted RNA-binding protein with PIN domain
MLHYILDAHNIMNQDAAMKRLLDYSLTEARQLLVQLVEQYAHRRQDTYFTIVFDGVNAAVASTERNVMVRETRRFQEADDVIKDCIRREERPNLVTVVSSDTSVYNFARRSGCIARTTPEFLRELRSHGQKRDAGWHETKRLGGEEKPTSVSRAELETMKKLFGLK